RSERARERSAHVELRAGCASCPVQCEQMYVVRERTLHAGAAAASGIRARPTADELLWESLVLCPFVRGVIDDPAREGAALLRAVNGGRADAALLLAAAARAHARWDALCGEAG
ncbi:MAG: hypothetical protein WCE44_06265, partial [Candidatus Velthaea sp.]